MPKQEENDLEICASEYPWAHAIPGADGEMESVRAAEVWGLLEDFPSIAIYSLI